MTPAPTGPPDRFRLLFVCTGNICRSPFAQFHTRFLLEGRLGPRAGAWFQIASAGTGAVVGSGMHPLTRPRLTTRAEHPDVAAFRSRQIPDRDVLLSDLVLTMTREHRARVLTDVPQALRTVFTLREFARLVSGIDPGSLPADPVARARAVVAAAPGERGTRPPADPEADDVPDPIGGDEADHAASTDVVDAAVRAVLDVLVPPPRRPGPPPFPVPRGRPGVPAPPRPVPPPAGVPELPARPH